MVKLKEFSLVILAALLLSASFAPLSIWFSAPIAYALYLKILSDGKRPILNSFAFAFIANALILSWSKTFVGITPWLLLSLLQGLYLIPVGLVARYVKSPVAWIAALLIVDEIKSYFPFGGFGWTRVAFSQADSPFTGLLPIFGVIGLSGATLVFSLAIFSPRRAVILSLISLALISNAPTTQTNVEGLMRVRAVQGGVPERGLSFNARAQAVLDNHIAVTLEESSPTDQLIIWPENAIDVDPIQNKLVSEKLDLLQQDIQTPLLAGAILSDEKLFNAALLFDENSKVRSTYIKRYLTPFGEYIPLRSLASAISPHASSVTDFSPGDIFVSHQIGRYKVSSVICYEILSDQIMRESARSSEFIGVLTNSATFSGSAEGKQQLNITRIRAIESARSVISVSTTGPSAFINYRGEVGENLGDGEVGSIAASVELRDGQTLATQYGGIISSFVILLCLAFIIFSLSRKRGQS